MAISLSLERLLFRYNCADSQMSKRLISIDEKASHISVYTNSTRLSAQVFYEKESQQRLYQKHSSSTEHNQLISAFRLAKNQYLR